MQYSLMIFSFNNKYPSSLRGHKFKALSTCSYSNPIQPNTTELALTVYDPSKLNSVLPLDINIFGITPFKIYANPDPSSRASIRKELRQYSGIYYWHNNVTGESYTGSGAKLSRRYGEYTNKKYLEASNRKINKALLHYPINLWTFVVIEVRGLEISKKELLGIENYWLAYLNNSYNMNKFANSPLGTKRSESTRLLMSQKRMGKTHSEETKNLIGDSNRGSNSANWGKERPQEVKDKISETMRGNTYNSVTVYVYNAEDMKFINKYPSFNEAGRNTGLYGKIISIKIREGKSYKGFFFSDKPLHSQD
uniref:Putative GIY-YIG endonuclease n=1 Tax=Blastocladiella emersonii TaxID=4808 RepID=B6A7T1_BLAEM|nr:putative GIY-YIG endonuclease [Blastocladiella emersonii]ABB78022.1 putative GIY-YIG endonuclease [Blastocladiella emersonii]